jgi:hypothetical protein
VPSRARFLMPNQPKPGNRWHRVAASEATHRNRLRAKAQAIAHGRLARRYPNVYRALYEQAKREVGLDD